ncbi:MAG: YhgE/Pip domain-containing protein [Clostridiales bacterium]|nr:YhgE/Pip domain-containing protein [Clostridiales bacterium]MDU3243400.1 YhgE/Pip domain-containing protein [Clostridiales bacterium]
MKKIFRIYVRDLSRLSKNVMAMIVVIGVSIIPALYAWFNIAANWDPYGSTSGIKVAVSNEDKGWKMDRMNLDVGSQIMDNLKANDQIGWEFTDTQSAVDGVKSGKYYAAVVIPEDFSKKISSILSTNIESPKIQYYINEKKNAIAPKITDKGVGVIQQQVNSTFISVATETIAGILNTTTGDLQENGNTLIDRLINVMQVVDSDLSQYSSTIDAFSETIDGVNTLLSTTKLTLPDLSSTLENGTQTINDSQSVLDTSKSSLNSVNQSFGNVLNSAQDIYDSISNTASQAFGDINNDISDAAGQLAQTTQLAQAIIDMNTKNINILTDLNAQLPEPKDEINNLIDKLNTSSQNQQSIIDKINATSESIKNASDISSETRNSISSVISGSKDEISGIRASYMNSVQPMLDNLMDEITKTGSDLSGLLQSTNGSLSNLDGIFDGMSSSLTSGQKALSSTKDVIGSTHDKIQNIISQLNSVGKDKKLQKLMEIIQNDPDLMGSFMSSPVQLETTSFYPIENYGSAMAPFYTTLAIWVGGIVLVAILKVRVDEDEKLKNLRPSHCYLGRYLLFMTLGLIQAFIICMGDLYFLEIQCKDPLLFVAAGLLSSFVYTNIIYTLTVSFGDIGKALCVILLVIQIAGAGGTFPIEVTPRFFQNVYPFLPFTYGINAMRETVAGIYGSNYIKDLLHLLVYVPLALMLGLILRKPLIRLNIFFEKRLEDTHLM